MIPISHILGLGLTLFAIGLAGVLARKNLVTILMSAELMLNGVNVILAGYGHHMKSPTGSIFALFVIMVAVSEAAVGFALMLSYFRQKPTCNLDEINDLKG
ncbi:MAG: NADH-quinone oxidoreductase subunit NuoK [Spirochaetes bacterium]|nr:MAG: NADH-quinone oxidoreductase subunit NuoK [Spirochaetota bacterium]